MHHLVARPAPDARRLIGVIVAAFCASACGAAPGDTGSQVEVSDSAGVQLVRNLDPAVDTAAVELTEEMRIGVLDGAPEYQFFRIASVAIDAEGRIFVADAAEPAVRIYDRDGRFVRGFGRTGRGPGEFSGPFGLFLRHDTIHVGDRGGSGFTSALFDTTGTLLATFSTMLPNGSSIRPLGATASGWLVSDDSLFSRQAREQAGDMVRSLTTIARVPAAQLRAVTGSRAVADSLLVPVVSYQRGRIFYSLGSEGGSERFPLGNPPFFEPAPSHAIDERGFIHVAAGWPYAIETYDTDGRLVRRVTRAHDSIPVDDVLLGALMRRVRAHYDTLTQVRGASMDTYERRAQHPRVGFVPVTSTIHASSDGWLWVRRPDLEPDPTTLEFSTGLPPRPSWWDVFDPDGVLRHTVQLPPRFAPRVVSGDAVVGVMRDELDVQYVARFRLRPRADG